jgi:signal peptidase I
MKGKTLFGIGLFLVILTITIVSTYVSVNMMCPNNRVAPGLKLPSHHSDVDYEKEIVVVGTSMMPTFAAGNTLLLKRYSDQDLKEGMIACYEQDSEYMPCHRLISVVGNKIIAKGDNNNFEEYLDKSDVVWLVVGVRYT